jgi:hypothetical protein
LGEASTAGRLNLRDALAFNGNIAALQGALAGSIPGQTTKEPPIAEGKPSGEPATKGQLWRMYTDKKNYEFDFYADTGIIVSTGDLIGIYREKNATTGVAWGHCLWTSGHNTPFYITDKAGATTKIVWYNWAGKSADDSIEIMKVYDDNIKGKAALKETDDTEAQDRFDTRIRQKGIVKDFSFQTDSTTKLKCIRYTFDPKTDKVAVAHLERQTDGTAKWVDEESQTAIKVVYKDNKWMKADK